MANLGALGLSRRIVLSEGLPATPLGVVRTTVYYVDAVGGNDANNGLSPATPWQTVDKVNNFAFPTGNIVIKFKGGVTHSYATGVALNTPRNNVTVTSYGTGRATINCTDTTGVWGPIYFNDCSNITVTNINVTGVNPATGFPYGVMCDAIAANMSNINISNVDATGFGVGGGIIIGADPSGAAVSCSNVTITGCTVHDSPLAASPGIFSYANPSATNRNTNIKVLNCTVNNVGNSGIRIGQTNTSLVDHCTVYSTGGAATAGPIGIWCYDSDSCVIQYCESYNNTVSSGSDGGGFDIDGGCTNCIIQYSYAHGNRGAGFMMWAYTGSAMNNNTIRYNISESNGVNTFYGEITVGRSGTGTCTNAFIYNNTCYNGRGASNKVFYCDNTVVTGRVANNIFYAAGATNLLTSANGAPSQVFTGNDWFCTATPTWVWNGTTYTTYASWQTATGQEKISGSNVGLTSNPSLVSPGGGTAASYKLQSGSPMLGAGLNLQAQFGINPGSLDYFGNSIAPPYNVGAGAT